MPPKLGLHYLDAPTPYIMGVKASATPTSDGELTNAAALPLTASHSIQCRINCDENKVEFIVSDQSAKNVRNGTATMAGVRRFLPPFINELADDVTALFKNDARIAAYAADTKHGKNKLLRSVVQIAKKHNLADMEFSYLDELKFNQRVRIACITVSS